jgi:glycosyltransferase involved in cell wall biosynthesis
MPTLHILTSPNSPVNIINRIDPFSIAAVKFIKHMQLLGWKCIHYGIAGSQVDCEMVMCLPEISHDHETDVKIYNDNAAKEISSRKNPGDFIMCFHGWENRTAAEANSDLFIVEPSIGYDISAVFAPFRAFTSYAQMHMFYGKNNMLMEPSWFDAVIPNAITVDEFEYQETKKDYVLYFGRIVERKGVNIAIQATKAAGVRLIVAGPGSLEDIGYKEIPSHVNYAGPCNMSERKLLMRDARAIIGPTLYVEPFGNMVVEGYMSGTPAITTDWGGFAETVIQGVTGYRCREFKDFVAAIENADKIDPKVCRGWAVENYSDEVVHRKFDDYFKRIGSRTFYR